MRLSTHPPVRANLTYLAAASLGGMAGAFYATNVGATRPFGMEGWRFAFLLVRAGWG